MTPGDSSSPFLSCAIFSSCRRLRIWILRSVRSSISRISSTSPFRESTSTRMRSSTVSLAMTSRSSAVPFAPGGGRQGRVPHVARFLSEDRPEQLLLGGELRLALGRHLADQDVARADVGPDADDPRLVEVLEEVFRHVRDVPRDLLRPELGVARLDLELFDVNRREVIIGDQLLG